MTATAKLRIVEVDYSRELQREIYKVVFDLSDRHGPDFDQRAVVSSATEDISTFTEAVITIEIPRGRIAEDRAISQAREVLHASLTRLAEAAKTPPAD